MDDKIIKDQDVAKNKNEKSTFPISIRKNAVCNSTVKILRQAMTQEKPRGHSRIEKLKTVMNKKML